MRILNVVLCLFVAVGAAGAAAAGPVPPQAAAEARTAVPSPVNLNTATLEQLQKLPGIGPKTAARILEYRQKNGSFKKIEELMNVRGVGEKSFLKIKGQLTVASKTERP